MRGFMQNIFRVAMATGCRSGRLFPAGEKKVNCYKISSEGWVLFNKSSQIVTGHIISNISANFGGNRLFKKAKTFAENGKKMI